MRPEDRTAINAWLDKVLEKVLDVLLKEQLITEEEAKRVHLRYVEPALAPRSERREGEPANASDYDHRIHSCPDARVWAKFFMDCKREWGWEVDEEAMRGWFANAMMAMHDHIKTSAPAAPKAPERGACERCGGTGKVPHDAYGVVWCPACGGAGSAP